MTLRPNILTSVCTLLFSAVWFFWLAASSPASAKPAGGPSYFSMPSQAETQVAGASKSFDACSLLTGSEIANVLGQPLQELKPGAQSNGSVNMSHCLFVTRDFAKSASVAVATPSAGDSGARNLRAFWRNQFHSLHQQEGEKRPTSIKTPSNSAFLSSAEASQSQDEDEDAARKPRAISALGEEAYWVGSPLSGALYVLQGDLFLRISVGGVPKESERIAKSKSLATAILPRLHR